MTHPRAEGARALNALLDRFARAAIRLDGMEDQEGYVPASEHTLAALRNELKGLRRWVLKLALEGGSAGRGDQTDQPLQATDDQVVEGTAQQRERGHQRDDQD